VVNYNAITTRTTIRHHLQVSTLTASATDVKVVGERNLKNVKTLKSEKIRVFKRDRSAHQRIPNCLRNEFLSTLPVY